MNLIPVTSQETYGFSLDFKSGFLYGTAYEIIYPDSFSSCYLSELQWNLKPLYFAGIYSEYAPKNPVEKIGFYGSVELTLGLPMKTGVMEDRDWLTEAEIPGSLTLFSSHENDTKTAILADLKLGFSLPLVEFFFMRLYLGFSYMYYKIEALNGYIQYGDNVTPPYSPWDPEWPKIPVSGLGVDYSQHFFLFYPGLEFCLKTKKTMLNIGISVSPLIGCITIDNHYMRYPSFKIKSYLSGGLFAEPKIKLKFNFHGNFSAGLAFSYRYISGMRGNAEQKNNLTGVTTNHYDISGAEFKAVLGELLIGFSY